MLQLLTGSWDWKQFGINVSQTIPDVNIKIHRKGKAE